MRVFSVFLCLLALLGCEPSHSTAPTIGTDLDAGLAATRQRLAHAVEALPPPKPARPPCLEGYRCDMERLTREPQLKISEVRIHKGAHRLYLIAGDTVVREYGVAIGRGGAGPKQMEGDGRTPVGRYQITTRLSKSPWHLFLGVSYPNIEDQRRHRRLQAERKVPWDRGVGFGIGIHGRRANMADGSHKRVDWTLGCIALDNDEIEEVARLVPNGTLVVIES